MQQEQNSYLAIKIMVCAGFITYLDIYYVFYRGFITGSVQYFNFISPLILIDNWDQ
jgi:hypothetical protein